MKYLLLGFIAASFSIIKKMDKDNFRDQTEKFIAENGKMDSDRVKEFGQIKEETATMEIGLKAKGVDMEVTLQKVNIHIFRKNIPR